MNYSLLAISARRFAEGRKETAASAIAPRCIPHQGERAMPHAHIAGKAPHMRPEQKLRIPISSIKAEETPTLLSDAVKDIIIQRMTQRESPWRIAAYLQAELRIEIDSDQVLACWNARNAPPTQTRPGQEKESCKFRRRRQRTSSSHAWLAPTYRSRSPNPRRRIPRLISVVRWSSPARATRHQQLRRPSKPSPIRRKT